MLHTQERDAKAFAPVFRWKRMCFVLTEARQGLAELQPAKPPKLSKQEKLRQAERAKEQGRACLAKLRSSAPTEAASVKQSSLASPSGEKPAGELSVVLFQRHRRRRCQRQCSNTSPQSRSSRLTRSEGTVAALASTRDKSKTNRATVPEIFFPQRQRGHHVRRQTPGDTSRSATSTQRTAGREACTPSATPSAPTTWKARL